MNIQLFRKINSMMVLGETNYDDDHLTARHRGCSNVIRSWFKTPRRVAAVVFLVGLLLLVGLLICFAFSQSTDSNLVEHNEQLTIRVNNLSNENDQLLTKYNHLSKERDQLQTNYNNLSKERDQLQTNYNNLSKERDQLQTNYNNLSKERDQLQTNYNNLSKERDQLQTNYNLLSKERDQLQNNYNNLSNERDQLQSELIQEQISNQQHLKDKSGFNYQSEILLYSSVLITCLSCVMMF